MLFSILHQQQELGRSATEAGLACLPFNAAVVAGSMLAGRIRLGSLEAHGWSLDV